jgi:hypothetical protein
MKKSVRNFLIVLAVLYFAIAAYGRARAHHEWPDDSQAVEWHTEIINFLAVEVRDIWYLGFRSCQTEQHEICSDWTIIERQFESQEEAYEFAAKLMEDINKRPDAQTRPLPIPQELEKKPKPYFKKLQDGQSKLT